MNDYICVGKIINTFGIKGELKIASDFEYKERVFLPNFTIYIGQEKIKEVINTHRIHKNYDMVLFKGYSNINEVLKYKDSYVYINRDELKLKSDEYLLSDLIGYEVYEDDKLLGVVGDYEYNNGSVLLKVIGEHKFYLPKVGAYIKEIDQKQRRILTNKGSELII